MHPSEHPTMNETRQSCRTIPGRDAANQRVSSKDFEAAVRAAAETADDLLRGVRGTQPAREAPR